MQACFIMQLTAQPRTPPSTRPFNIQALLPAKSTQEGGGKDKQFISLCAYTMCRSKCFIRQKAINMELRLQNKDYMPELLI